MRVVGLDLSLTAAGVAEAISTLPHGQHVRTEVMGSEAAGIMVSARALRLRRLASQIVTRVTAAPVDLVVIEQPSYGSTGGAAHDRSGLWWLVCARLDAYDVPVAEVAPNTLKTYALGKGSGVGTGKDAVLAAAVRRYIDYVPELASNDAADALILADMGLRHLGEPLIDLPQTHTRALAAVRWPSTPSTNGAQHG